MSTKDRARKEARKAAKKAEKEKKKAEGELKEVVYIEGKQKTVERSQRFSIRALPMELQEAVRRFEKDYESAFEALSAPELGIKVDGGGIHEIDTHRIAAQERLALLAANIRPIRYEVLVSIVVYGVNAKVMDYFRGMSEAEIGPEIKDILRRVSEFYSVLKPRDRLFEAAQLVIEAAETGSDIKTIEAERMFQKEWESIRA